MSTPETKDHLIRHRITKAAEELWHQVKTGTLGPNNPLLNLSLEFLDRSTEQWYGHAFAETFRERRFFIKDVVSINTEDYHYYIGYSNDEANQGLRFLRASWASGNWNLSVDIYHFAGYHRLHQVTIKHQGQQVMFFCPKEFVGKKVPANTLPTDIEIK